MNTENKQYCDVTFAFCVDSLLREAHAESSYVVASVYNMSSEKTDVTPLILSEDELPLVRRAVKDVYTALLTRLQAYLGCGNKQEDDTYYIVVRLPKERKSSIDDLILHELQRSFVSFLLSKWFENKLPEQAAYYLQLYSVAIDSVLHDIFMAYGGMKRTSSYI